MVKALAYSDIKLIRAVKSVMLQMQKWNLQTVIYTQAYCRRGLITIVIFYNHYRDSKLKMTDIDVGSSLLWYRINYDNKRL